MSEMMNRDLLRMHEGAAQRDFRRSALWYWLNKQLIPGRTLDVGGGSGYMTLKLLAEGREVMLAEPEADLIVFARHQVEKRGLSARFEAVDAPVEALEPAQVGQFANIVCLDVLEHIENDRQALRQLTRLIRPDGRILITVPAMPALYGTRDRAYGHYRRHTARSLRTLITDCGLECTGLRYWNLLGVAPYYFYEKVLKQPVNDSLRQGGDTVLTRSLRTLLTGWLKFETHLPLWAGLTLLAVTRLPVGTHTAEH